MLSNILPLFSSVITPNWTVTKNASYGSSSEQKFDCYRLNHGIRPAIILIHGGGWMSGDKSAYESTAKRYALAGFHVFAINYTLAKAGLPQTQWAVQLRDVETAVKYIRENAQMLRVDPNRIVASGDSAGGHLALFLATTRNVATRVSAVLNMYGPTTLVAPEMAQTLSTTPVFNFSTDSDLLNLASPTSYINSQSSPVCTIHGTKDTVVPYQQAERLKEKLDACLVYNEIIPYDGGHGFANVPWYVQTYLNMRGLWFLKRFV